MSSKSKDAEDSTPYIAISPVGRKISTPITSMHFRIPPPVVGRPPAAGPVKIPRLREIEIPDDDDVDNPQKVPKSAIYAA